jgi:hypothetical protein
MFAVRSRGCLWFAAGLLRTRHGPHTGGFPHPENLLPGNPFPDRWLVANPGWDVSLCGFALKEMLAEPEAVEVLAKVPAAARALRPIVNLLGEVPTVAGERRDERLDRLAREIYANVGIADAPRAAPRRAALCHPSAHPNPPRRCSIGLGSAPPAAKKTPEPGHPECAATTFRPKHDPTAMPGTTTLRRAFAARCSAPAAGRMGPCR